MARHVPNQATPTLPNGEKDGDKTEGGELLPGESSTPGIETRTTMPDDKYKNSSVVANADPPTAPKRKLYEVINQRDHPALYGGCHVTFKPGKVIDSVAYDIAKLKQQGVKLKEIVEDEPEG